MNLIEKKKQTIQKKKKMEENFIKNKEKKKEIKIKRKNITEKIHFKLCSREIYLKSVLRLCTHIFVPHSDSI